MIKVSGLLWKEEDSVKYGKQALEAIEKIVRFKSGKSGRMFLLIIFKDPGWIEYVRDEFAFIPNSQPMKAEHFLGVPTHIHNKALLVQINDNFSAESLFISTIPDKNYKQMAEKEFSIIFEGEVKGEREEGINPCVK